MNNDEYVPYPWMTDGQRKCHELLCIVYGGDHHLPRVSRTPWGEGISCCVSAGLRLATIDYDGLTALIILAHHMAIRVEIVPSPPGKTKLLLHKRQRTGEYTERHPTIEEAIEKYEKYREKGGD